MLYEVITEDAEDAEDEDVGGWILLTISRWQPVRCGRKTRQNRNAKFAKGAKDAKK